MERKIGEKKERASRKDDIKDDKLRWDLLPLAEIEDVVRVYHAGAKKYGADTWQNLDNGFERFRAASHRHMMEYLKGEKIDSETGCYHLAAVIWNGIAMLYYDKHGKGKNFGNVKTDKFIEKASVIHSNKYDYSKVEYISTEKKVEIVCPIHGSFFQTPHNHLQGSGCPECRYELNKRLICGIGINDLQGGKSERSYNIWMHLIKRCYSKKKKLKAYALCSVCDEWKIYSNFKKFYDDNCKSDTYHLDKDILIQGNKLYSPATCAFIPEEVNECLKSEWTENKILPLGVTFTKYGKYRARCIVRNHEKQEHLGVYETAEEAFLVYKEHKKRRIAEMAEKYYSKGEIDKRVYDAMMSYEIYPFGYGDERNNEYMNRKETNK